MRIIISPAKQMRIDTDLFTCTELPVFMEKTEILMRWIDPDAMDPEPVL